MYDILYCLTIFSESEKIKAIESVLKKNNYVKIKSHLDKIQSHKYLFKSLSDNFKIILDKNTFSNVNQLILETTQNCNFRCKYCVFSGNYHFERKHNILDMKEEIAFKAIDYFLGQHVKSGNKPIITFYGGEPLLNKDLIYKCVNYAKSINKNTVFTVQTNGSLLNEEVINFMIKNEIFISVSIDGPKKIHDKYRVMKKGEGSYDKIMSNLNLIYTLNKNFFKKLMGISITMGTDQYMNDIVNFIEQDLLIKEINNLNINYINKVGHKKGFLSKIGLIQKDDNSIISKNFDNYIKSISLGGKVENIFFTRGLAKIIFRRPILNNQISLLGPCQLGKVKLFVSADGGFKICDKTSRLPFIGNYKVGIDWHLINTIEKNFLENTEDCYNCWALPLCSICWVHVYSDSFKVNKNMKKQYCEMTKNSLLVSLQRYTHVIEIDPNIVKIIAKDYNENVLK